MKTTKFNLALIISSSFILFGLTLFACIIFIPIPEENKSFADGIVIFLSASFLNRFVGLIIDMFKVNLPEIKNKEDAK